MCMCAIFLLITSRLFPEYGMSTSSIHVPVTDDYEWFIFLWSSSPSVCPNSQSIVFVPAAHGVFWKTVELHLSWDVLEEGCSLIGKDIETLHL